MPSSGRHRLAATVGWWLGAAGVAAVYLVLLAAPGRPPVDLIQLGPALQSMARGDLAGVYRPGTLMTSPPGYLLLAAPVLAALGGTLSHPAVWETLGAVSTLPLVVTGCRLLRVLRPSTTRWGHLALGAALLLFLPFLSAVKVDYHPEDLLAVAFLFAAIEASLRHRTVATGLAVAGLLLTRQWGLLALAPLLVYQGRDAGKVTAVAATAGALVTAPFALACGPGLLRALFAPVVVAGGSNALLAQLALPRMARYLLARVAPVALSVPSAVVLRRRWRRSPPVPAALVGACLAGVSYRMVFETDSLDYYLAPLVALVLVLALSSTGRHRVGLLVSAVVAELALLVEPSLPGASAPVVASCMEALYLAWVVTGWSSALRGPAAPGRSAPGGQGGEQLLRGVLRADLVPDLGEGAVGADEEGRADDPQVLLAVHGLLPPDAVGVGDAVVGVGEQGEAEPVLGVEAGQGGRVVGADADHRSPTELTERVA